MDMGVDQTGEDDEIAEVGVGRTQADRHEHTVLVVNGGRPLPILQDDAVGTEGRHGIKLPAGAFVRLAPHDHRVRT